MYKMDISQHAPSDVRLLAPYYLDDEWEEIILTKVLDEAEPDHSIEPEDVSFNKDETEFTVTVDCAETKQNEAVAGSLPMLIIHTDVFKSATMSEAESVGAMLLDSGLIPTAVDGIVGADNWRHSQTIASNYEVMG